ncbi:MAG TPA: hypothetical protein DCS23_03785 [Candidatus Yonathbacteria bacterium]|nr:hypothetical protein [Candidatus Yonathbacteria bacterium]
MSSPRPKNKTEKRLETLAVKTRAQKQAFLEQLLKYPIVQVACEKSGVGRSTYYAWRKDDKEFAKLADIAMRSGELFINDMAESRLIQNIQNGHTTSIIFWLKNHHGGYNDRIVHEHEHSLELVDEDRKAIVKALMNIGLGNVLKNNGINPEQWHEKQRLEKEGHMRRVNEVIGSAPEKKDTVFKIPPLSRPLVAGEPSAPVKKRPVKKGININEYSKNNRIRKRLFEGK